MSSGEFFCFNVYSLLLYYSKRSSGTVSYGVLEKYCHLGCDEPQNDGVRTFYWKVSDLHATKNPRPYDQCEIDALKFFK